MKWQRRVYEKYKTSRRIEKSSYMEIPIFLLTPLMQPIDTKWLQAVKLIEII